MNKFTQLPKFKTASQEKAFWETHDSTDYIDWSHAKQASFPNLKPSTKTISLRLPENLLNDIKTQANKEDVPYQSLMKLLLDFGLKNFFQLNLSPQKKPQLISPRVFGIASEMKLKSKSVRYKKK